MSTVQIDPKPQGEWRKWQAIDEDVYTYSLLFTDLMGEERVQNWSYTPSIRPGEFEVKNALVRLEKQILAEGGTF